MNYKVKSIHVFERQVKRLIKKNPSLKQELATLIIELKRNPETGIPLGKNCFKFDLLSSQKAKASQEVQG